MAAQRSELSLTADAANERATADANCMWNWRVRRQKREPTVVSAGDVQRHLPNVNDKSLSDDNDDDDDAAWSWSVYSQTGATTNCLLWSRLWRGYVAFTCRPTYRGSLYQAT